MTDVAVVRLRRDRAYWRLSHAARTVFDVECAERAVACCDPRHEGDVRVRQLLEVARVHAAEADLAPMRIELRHAIEAARDVEDHTARIALALARAAYAASAPLVPGLASSDYVPTSAGEALNALYLDAYVRTADLDAAEAAVHEELRWQADRAEALVAPR